jgi:hypothetical protein
MVSQCCHHWLVQRKGAKLETTAGTFVLIEKTYRNLCVSDSHFFVVQMDQTKTIAHDHLLLPPLLLLLRFIHLLEDMYMAGV